MNLKQRIFVLCLVLGVAAVSGLAMSAQTEAPASSVASVEAACPAPTSCPPECRPVECSPEERAACAQRAASCSAEAAAACKAKNAS